jgi:hypothetical protein
MNEFCQDRDLLALEPAIFLGGSFVTQQLIGGSDGVSSGTTFTSAGSNFGSAGVQAGMVLTVYDTAASEGNAFEIISVNSATALTVSVLRADPSLPPVAPKISGRSFFIRTFRPQIQGVSRTLAEKLKQFSEIYRIPAEKVAFADPAQLQLTTACGALPGIYLARAASATADDANWLKSEHYRQEFVRLQSQLRLTVDAGAGGCRQQTHTLGNVLLRRA